MATTTAAISLSSDITDNALSVSNEANLYTAGTTTGLNTMTSVTKVLASTNQVDLITTGSVSTTHAYVYINNPDADSTRHFKITIGNAGAGSPTDTEEIGRLYGGDWMWFPWDVDDDICIQPSDSNDMTVEYMVFS
jgi:hypothetical protein|tara:strand:+ start:871 stop:1278 length:408 start_codon:yes stop_codon:yes gene_type:complete